MGLSGRHGGPSAVVVSARAAGSVRRAGGAGARCVEDRAPGGVSCPGSHPGADLMLHAAVEQRGSADVVVVATASGPDRHGLRADRERLGVRYVRAEEGTDERDRAVPEGALHG
jgi:hypothetical protein